MKILIIIFVSCVICSSCGVKDNPKYETQNNINKKIKVI
jgi:hypothetical protein